MSDYKLMANAIRFLAIDAVEAAQSGHPGMPMGMADVATVLFKDFLNFDPVAPDWPNRDRFILSAGHGSMLLYSLLYLTGYEEATIKQLQNFRTLGSLTAGHPEYGHLPGIETTTGPLGQGLANAVGMAIAEKLSAARKGNSSTDHYTYVMCSDGDLMEGISHEAMSLAGHLGLGKLVVLFDDNGISIDGPTSLTVSDDQIARFKAYGWHTQSIDGHDYAAINKAIELAQKSDQPSFIACKTTIGYGSPNKAGSANVHGSPLGKNEISETRKALDWDHPPFTIPETILNLWQETAHKGMVKRQLWEMDGNSIEPTKKPCAVWEEKLDALISQFIATPPKQATRQLSQQVLEEITPFLPNLIGGSADLTGSNNTKSKSQAAVTVTDFSGQYIHYGIREHAMAAIMNGISLYGDFIPYGGTFLVFSDYLRPALRLSALMNQGVIYVLTHDSIGLGEDGPTHQPVEHLAALRAIPNLNVFRPCDAVEVAECWKHAIKDRSTPSVIVLTRQNVQPVRLSPSKDNLAEKGAYILSDSAKERQVTLIATGSEVELALAAQKELETHGISAAVVSMPCWRLFDKQSKEYQEAILGTPGILKVAIEAALRMGWDRYIDRDGIFIGMNGFGASGKAESLYKYFGITAEAIVQSVLKKKGA